MPTDSPATRRAYRHWYEQADYWSVDSVGAVGGPVGSSFLVAAE
jgi:hypothetical protein